MLEHVYGCLRLLRTCLKANCDMLFAHVENANIFIAR